MKKHRDTGICLETYSMFCIKNKLNFTVCRCIYSTFCWCHHCTVTHHFSCKSLIRCSRKICCDSVYRAVNDCCFSDLFFFYRCQGLCCTCIFVLNLCTVLSICIFCCNIFLCLYIIRCLICEFVGSSLQIFFQLRLDNSYMRSIDNLYALSFFYDSSGICLFQKFITNSLRFCNCDTKSTSTIFFFPPRPLVISSLTGSPEVATAAPAVFPASFLAFTSAFV